MGNINSEQLSLLEQQLAESQAREKVRLDALRELMSYNPRMTYRGGVESGYMQPAGSAILSVLDKCDAALAQPTDDTALRAALANERERCAKVCDAEQEHWEKMRISASKYASEQVLYGYSGREESAGACAGYIRALGDE